MTENIKASLFAGALGDSLGAPVEIMKLSTILDLTGPEGVQQLMHYDPGDHLKYAPCEQTGVGVITDDTCMTAATMAGLINSGSSIDEKIVRIHQAYLRWGQHQAWAEGDYSKMMDATIEWPSWFDLFCFSSGAGKNTLLALNSGKMGTLHDPIVIQDHKTGLDILGEGCGGMMRVAPVAWTEMDVGLAYHLGCCVAAITHGGDTAINASGAIAMLIRRLLQGFSWDTSVLRTQMRLESEPRKDALRYVTLAVKRGYDLGENITFEDVDDFPVSIGAVGAGLKPNRFLASAVLTQAMLIATASQTWDETPEAILRRALTLAVTQSGDSDSVGAIVGNILGAQLGMAAIPQDLMAQIQNLAALEAMYADLKLAS